MSGATRITIATENMSFVATLKVWFKPAFAPSLRKFDVVGALDAT
jgi:hypothetical protein